MSNWTTTADLRAQVQRLWDKGRLLACLVSAEDLFPLRLTLKDPLSSELSERFDEVRAWARLLQQDTKAGYRLEMREIRHRVIGNNALPAEAWVDSLEEALHLIGKKAQAQRFVALVAATRASQPSLLPWLQAHPLRALALAQDWPKLIEVVAWLQAHPRPGVYLRQVDLPGVHSKYIEDHAAVLSELFDLALPASAIDESSGGTANLPLRYGFRTKPVRVRFRMLDPRCSLLGTGADEDITLDSECFARLAPAVSRVFITENEVNFLAFPPVAQAMVIFGAGYGFDMLASARWLHEETIHYWGDIDTHGFAILDQLRVHFAHVESFLMDHATLMAHGPQWTDEPQPMLRDLPRLTPAERRLFDDLRWKRLVDRQVRLEQERVGFHCVEAALASLGMDGPAAD
jgi:hypothetical protein